MESGFVHVSGRTRRRATTSCVPGRRGPGKRWASPSFTNVATPVADPGPLTGLPSGRCRGSPVEGNPYQICSFFSLARPECCESWIRYLQSDGVREGIRPDKHLGIYQCASENVGCREVDRHSPRNVRRPATASTARRSSAICIVVASSQASPAGPGQWVARRGRYARKGARSGRARSLLDRALVPLARSEDPPEDGGKFLPRVTTHTDICMIHFPAAMSRYRFAPECPEL